MGKNKSGKSNGSAPQPDAGPSNPPSPPQPATETIPESEVPPVESTRSSTDDTSRISQLEDELETVRGEKETLGNQYRALLGKLTAMRQSLGDKLREDAEELDRRETQINQLTGDITSLQNTITTLQSELESQSNEANSLQNQLTQLRSQSDSSSSDVLSLTREMRELRGEMERLRSEREEWEAEAGRERERREQAEEELRAIEWREREGRKEWEEGRDQLERERERADNLQEVLGEFQAAKESELQQATSELEIQLRTAATSLSEFKLRAANAETKLGDLANTASRSAGLEKEIRDRNQLIAKLRHDAVVNNEHLTEALRRLRKTSSDNNVDRRLVNNILLAFLAAPRADSKRFEMLSILSTILSWDDSEREKAGLQKVGKGKAPPMRRKGSTKDVERSAEEEAAMNESFSNLFVEFLMKESSQGQARASPSRQTGELPSPGIKSPPPFTLFSPTSSGHATPAPANDHARRMSSASSSSNMGPGQLPATGRKASYGLSEALEGRT